MNVFWAEWIVTSKYREQWGIKKQSVKEYKYCQTWAH